MGGTIELKNGISKLMFEMLELMSFIYIHRCKRCSDLTPNYCKHNVEIKPLIFIMTLI